MAGYSRLMQDGEAARVKTLEIYKHLISELIRNLFHAAPIPAGLKAVLVILTPGNNNNYYSSKGE